MNKSNTRSIIANITYLVIMICFENSQNTHFRCMDFGRPVLCHHQFHQCEGNQPIASLCKRDCELFKYKYCRDELRLIRKMSSEWLKMYIPECSLLSDDNDKCVPISTALVQPGTFQLFQREWRAVAWWDLRSWRILAPLELIFNLDAPPPLD